MVDYQSISITLAALSFVIAAIYYSMNIREAKRNRRITLTNTVLQPFMTEEGYSKIMDLYAMEWSSLDDFNSKYDHRADRENAARRLAMWNMFETIGMLYREGLLDIKTLYGGSGGVISVLWFKFKPIIEMYRGADFDERAYENFEYLAERLLEYTKERGGKSLGVYAARTGQVDMMNSD